MTKLRLMTGRTKFVCGLVLTSIVLAAPLLNGCGSKEPEAAKSEGSTYYTGPKEPKSTGGAAAKTKAQE